MDAARALADLVEISPQIEAAAVVSRGGGVAGAAGLPEAEAEVVASAARELLDGAGAFRRGEGRVTQLHAELADGQVLAVSAADGKTIVAVTGGPTAPGLLFHDLKRCLAALADEA